MYHECLYNGNATNRRHGRYSFFERLTNASREATRPQAANQERDAESTGWREVDVGRSELKEDGFARRMRKLIVASLSCLLVRHIYSFYSYSQEVTSPSSPFIPTSHPSSLAIASCSRTLTPISPQPVSDRSILVSGCYSRVDPPLGLIHREHHRVNIYNAKRH